MTWPWWARARPAWRPRSMRLPKGCRCWCSMQRAFGGQAGASARIENYLGFPTGISGQALAGRAFNQAQKFGAEVAIPLEVRRLDCDGRRGAGRAARRWPNGGAMPRADGGDRVRRPLPAAGHRATWPSSRAPASPTGPRRSRRSSARARRWRWSAPATRPVRRSSSSRPKVKRLHLIVRGAAWKPRCRAT